MTCNHTDHEKDPQDSVRAAYMLALVPLVQEGLALLTEAINDLRHEMALARADREELAPLERELRAKRLKAELEDFDLDREEAKLDRVERAADREANKVVREERLKSLKPYTFHNKATHSSINGSAV